MGLNVPNESSCPHADIQCTDCDTCWVRFIDKEPTPSTDKIKPKKVKCTLVIGGGRGKVKMNDEKLAQLNELSRKIKLKKAALKNIDALIEESKSAITFYNSEKIRVPEELNSTFFTLLRDFYAKQLTALEKEFEGM